MISRSIIALKQLKVLLLEVAISSSSTRKEVVEDTITIKIEEEEVEEFITEVEEVGINFIITEVVVVAASNIIDLD